jgi:tetratricopeptide (TPR) repeat protein
VSILEFSCSGSKQRNNVNTIVGEEGDELLILLDGLPLALAQAAAYMSETGTSFSTYTRLYKEQWRELMEPHNRRRTPLRSYANRSVATTWTVSYTAVRARNEAAANLLLLWAHLDNKSLWHGLLAAASHELDVAAERTAAWLGAIARSEVEFIEAVRMLRSYSLVEEAEDQTGYSMHPVVHQWAFYMQDSRQQTALSRLAVMLVGLAVPENDERKDWETLARLLPHARRCETRIGAVVNQGAEQGAEEWAEDEQTLLWAIHNLGCLYSEQGKLNEAEKMYTQALEGCKKILGEDHVQTLGVVTNLGVVYMSQGKLEQAEKMYTQALEGCKKILGEDHVRTLGIVANLGALYMSQEKLEKAEAMLMLALEGCKKILGEDHVRTLGIVANLGALYRGQGKLEKAETMLTQALEGHKKAFGEDHTSTLRLIYNLGVVYNDQGKLKEAETMLALALEGQKKAFREEHTLTLRTVHSLGMLYYSQGKLKMAETMFTQALEGYKKLVGPEGIHTYMPARQTLRVLSSLHDIHDSVDKAKV